MFLFSSFLQFEKELEFKETSLRNERLKEMMENEKKNLIHSKSNFSQTLRNGLDNQLSIRNNISKMDFNLTRSTFYKQGSTSNRSKFMN